MKDHDKTLSLRIRDYQYELKRGLPNTENLRNNMANILEGLSFAVGQTYKVSSPTSSQLASLIDDTLKELAALTGEV